MESYGILIKNSEMTACPLQKVKVDARLDMDLANVKITQEYYYRGKSDIEAIYKFPLSSDALVTGFKVKLGTEEIVGELKEKEEAFKQYEREIKKGNTSFMLESHRDDIFQISLGNIKSNEKITIEVQYMENLKTSSEFIRWILPTTIAPKYLPYGYEVSPDLEIQYGDSKYTLELKIRILDKYSVKKVLSPSHPLEFAYDNNDILIELGKEIEYLDRDFILNIYHDVLPNNSLWIGSSKNNAFGEIRFIPELDYISENDSNKEYIFILDTSGSMAGDKIEQGKRALNIALSNLLEGDKFNIISFSNNFNTFNDDLVNYTNAALKKAKEWINSLQAYGGTEILEPLDYSLSLPKGKEERIIFLFTDGQVYNENEIIQTILNNSDGVRIYPFGIDTAINKHFIDELAKYGNGIPEYVYPGERIEDKVINQLSRISQPCFTHVTIKDSLGEEIETFPIIPKYMHSGEEYKFQFKVNETPCDHIVIEAKVNEEEKVIKIDNTIVVDGELLAIKWAKEYIRHLESLLGGNNIKREKLIKDDIVSLSLEYGILSTLTSLVAVYKRKDKNRGHIKTIHIPLNMPYGWEGSDEIVYSLNESIIYDSICKMNAPILEAPIRRIESKVSIIDKTKELMLDIAANQNANGSIGEINKELNTSYFIIAMLLYVEENRPYRKQIKKALFYLLDEHEKGLEAYLAMKLAYENDVYTEMDIEDRIEKIGKADDKGNLKYLSNVLTTDIQEFTLIYIGKRLEKKELITYLFEQIHNEH